jgi:hypothetical protein
MQSASDSHTHSGQHPALRRSRPCHAGFALIATLSIVALVILLAMALLGLGLSGTRQATFSRQAAEARANARLALALALGDLQKHAGPDQRVTATADLAAAELGDPVEAGKTPVNTRSLNDVPNGLSPVQPGTRHWAGVWRNAETPDSIYTKTPSANLVQWLVSGSGGRPGEPAVTPASPQLALGADGKPAQPASAILLAGPASVGPPTRENLENYVSVPAITLQSRSAGASPPGRLAWWAADEGVKAKVNLPHRGATLLTNATLPASRRGWETIDGFAAYPLAGTPAAATLDRATSLPQAALLDRSLATPAGGATPLQRAFHSAATDSLGVIADSLRGGIRLDLSAYLARSLSGGGTVPGVANAPAPGTNIIPRLPDQDHSPTRGPKWDRLLEFHNLTREAAAGTIKVRTATSDTQVTIAPTILDFRILMGARIWLVPGSTTDYRLNPCGKVAVALANPYSKTLEWDTPLEFQVIHVTPSGRPSRIWDAAGQPAFLPQTPGEAAVFNNAVFQIPAGSLAPGEAKAYTMKAPVLRPPGSTAPVVAELGDFASSTPNSMDICVELVNETANTGTKLLDVRESWTSSQINVELRQRGNSTPLRLLERFELDNAFFSQVRRQVTPAIAATMLRPFPLHLWALQVSQPGNRYDTILPGSDLLGTRSSTLRTFTDFNLAAARVPCPITSYNPPPYFMESSDQLAQLPFVAPGGETGLGFTRNLAVSPLSWGYASVGGPKQTILFDLPDQLVSLGQLQHADLTTDDQGASVAHQPGNALGNSYATPFVKRGRVVQTRDNYIVSGVNGGESVSSTKAPARFFDISYLLNTALWDGFFFSAIPASGPPRPLHPAIVKTNPADTSPELRLGPRAAGRLMIDGALNVNASSKDAWKALLAANNRFKHPADSDAAPGPLFPRSLGQTSPARTPPTGTGDDSYSGYRRLDEDELDRLAGELARQVRLRGPFVSLSHFINRSLVDLNKNPALGRCGPLQAAIDQSGLTISPDGARSAFASLDLSRERVTLLSNANAPRADMDGTQANGSRGSTYGGTTEDGDPVWAAYSRDLNPGAVASILADRPMLMDTQYRSEQGFRSTGIPGWLTQADLLQVLGPVLSARSDTFKVRTYGEAINQRTGRPTARAWCEAVVQRLPDFVDAANPPHARETELTALNRTFGRGFKVLSFRWLTSDEI